MYESYFKKTQIHCEGSWARSDYIMDYSFVQGQGKGQLDRYG